MALKLFSAFCVVGGSGLLYGSVRRFLDTGGRILFLAGMGGVVFMATFSGNVISEAGYLLMFGLFSFMVPRLDRDAHRPGLLFLMGTVAGVLLLVRNIGALAPLSLIVLGSRFFLKRAGAYVALGVLSVAVPASVWVHRLSGVWSFYESYWLLGSRGSFSSIATRFIENLYYYWKGLTCMTLFNLPAVFPPIPWVKVVFMVSGSLVVGRGLWLCWKEEGWRWLGLYFIGYMTVLGLWSYQAPRYAWPVYPLFLAFFGAGVRGAWRMRGGRVAVGGVLLGILFTNAPELYGLVRKSFSQNPVLSHESEKWLADHSLPDEIVVSMDIARVYYFTGRRGVPFIPSTDVASFEAGAHRLGATVFFFRDNDFVPAAPGVSDPIAGQLETLRSYLFGSKSFEPIYTNRDERTTIFRFRGSVPVV